MHLADADLPDYRVLAKPALALAGKTVDKNTEAPVAGVRLEAMPEEGPDMTANNYSQAIKSDAEGRFRLLVPAVSLSWRLWASPPPPYSGGELAKVTAKESEKRVEDIVIALEAGGTLAGVVLTSTGTPAIPSYVIIVGARDPKAVPHSWMRWDAPADGQGRFKMERIPAGHYTLEPAKGSGRVFNTGMYRPGPGALQLDLRPAEVRADIVLRLDVPPPRPPAPTGVLAGRVLDGDDKPLAGVWLHATCQDYSDDTAKRYESVTTDKDGAFRMENLRVGRYRLSAHFQDAEYQLGETTVPKEDVVLHMGRPGRIAGRVVGPYGEKIAQFRALLQRNEAKPLFRTSEEPDWRVVSNADGAFQFESLSPGSYRVSVQAEGYVPRLSEPIEVKAGETADTTVHLSGGGAVELHVVDGHGAPVEGALLFLREEWQEAFTNNQLPRTGPRCTDKGGSFVFRAQPEGQPLRVAAVKAGYGVGQGSIGVEANKTVKLELVLEAAGALEGTVSDAAGQPMAQISVGCQALPVGRLDELEHPYTRTDAQGHYVFSSLTPGKWEVTLTKYDRSDFSLRMKRVETIDIRPGEKAVLDFHVGEGQR